MRCTTRTRTIVVTVRGASIAHDGYSQRARTTVGRTYMFNHVATVVAHRVATTASEDWKTELNNNVRIENNFESSSSSLTTLDIG